MSKVLVTGGSGLLGRELCRQLKEANQEVWVIDNHSRSSEIPKCDKFILGDLIDSETYSKLPTNFDYIFHYGAINGTTNFYERPNEVLSKNFISDIKTFEFAQTCKQLNRVVYASSSEIVSGDPISPVIENLDVNIKNIHNARWSYRLAKITSENYLANSSLPYVMIRYFNVYGTNDGPGHFIPDQVKKMNQGIFEIIGADETRSFCHVSDAIKASIYCSENAANLLVNIGSDEEITISDAAILIAQSLGYENPNWTMIPSMAGSTKTRKPNISRLRNIMPNFNPRSFAQGIKEILS